MLEKRSTLWSWENWIQVLGYRSSIFFTTHSTSFTACLTYFLVFSQVSQFSGGWCFCTAFVPWTWWTNTSRKHKWSLHHFHSVQDLILSICNFDPYNISLSVSSNAHDPQCSVDWPARFFSSGHHAFWTSSCSQSKVNFTSYSCEGMTASRFSTLSFPLCPHNHRDMCLWIISSSAQWTGEYETDFSRVLSRLRDDISLVAASGLVNPHVRITVSFTHADNSFKYFRS